MAPASRKDGSERPHVHVDVVLAVADLHKRRVERGKGGRELGCLARDARVHGAQVPVKGEQSCGRWSPRMLQAVEAQL